MINRRMKIALAIVLLAGHALAANAGHHDEDRASLERAQEQLSRAMQRAGAIDGFIKHAAADVAYLFPGEEIVTGRAATRRLLQAKSEGVHTVLHGIAADVSKDGTLGYTLGWFEEVTPTLAYGRFIAMWRRKDHDWEVAAFLHQESTDPLAPPPPDALILNGVPGVVHFNVPEANALEIAIADSRFADLSVAQGYTIAFSAYMADAAVSVTPGPFFYNRPAVEAAFGGWTPAQMLRWHPLRAESAASGDLGWSIGHSTFTLFGENGSETHRFGKYLTVWLRTADGWRFLIDGGTPRPADP